MRIIKTLKNIFYAVGSSILMMFFSLTVRKVFVRSLPIDLLGYEGLFGNIFSILSIADLGIENLIIYRLISAVAQNDTKSINKILSLYKKLYRAVAIMIALIGIMIVFFLKYIIRDQELNWNYVYFIYFLQLSNLLITYLLAYKRILYNTDQKNYVNVKVDTIVTLCSDIAKIFVLIFLNNYFVYLLIGIFASLTSNLVISKKIKKDYIFYNDNVKVSLNDIKEMGLWSDVKNNMAQKIGGVIYGGTDNILISYFLGVVQVGIVSNYLLVSGYISKFIIKVLSPFQMSIGNYINTHNYEDNYRLFRMFDFISYIIATIVGVCYLNILNPFILLWMGRDYIIDINYVFAFVLNQYVLWNHNFVSYYRGALGRFEIDRNLILAAAFINILFSILMFQYFGIAGIMLGTAIGHIGIWFGRVKVVYTELIKESVFHYLKRQVFRFIIFMGNCFVVYKLSSNFHFTIFGLILRLLVALTVSTISIGIIWCKSDELKYVKLYIKETKNAISK